MNMTKPRMRIGEVRDVIQRAEHARNWLTGGTSEEFRKQQVGPSLRERIDAMKSLEISPRFAADIDWRTKEIERCEAVIARWNAAQTAAPVDNRVCIEGGPRHVLLGSTCCTLCGTKVVC